MRDLSGLDSRYPKLANGCISKHYSESYPTLFVANKWLVGVAVVKDKLNFQLLDIARFYKIKQ